MFERWPWLDKGFDLRLRPVGLLLVVAYALAYQVTRAISEDQWFLPAGLRVAVLLLFPGRYWPYLFVGEWVAMIGGDWPKLDTRGLARVLAPAVNMPIVAGIVHLHRRHHLGRGYGWFLSVAALAAGLVTLSNIGIDTFLKEPIDLSRPLPWSTAIRWALGHYLGILLLGPLVLLWQRRGQAGFSRKLRWDAVAALAVIAVLTLGVLGSQDAELLDRNGLRLLLLLPAIALTCLHGWRGSVIGVVGVDLAVYLSMDRAILQNAHDMEAFAVQEVLAVVGTALLGAGATISYYYHQLTRHRQQEQRLLALAKASVLAGDARRHQRAQRMHAGLSQDLQASGAAQAQQVREQLSLLYPADIERAGLYVALLSGAIADVWEQSGRLSLPELRGNPGPLSHALQHVAYDCISDAVELLLELEPGTLRVRARCGRLGGAHGILMQVGVLDPQRRLQPETIQRAQALFAGRALAYGGSLCCRRNTLSLLLSEPAQAYSPALPLQDALPPTERLPWVST